MPVETEAHKNARLLREAAEAALATVLADFDSATAAADALDTAGLANPDSAAGAVQVTAAVSERLKGLGALIRYATEGRGPQT